VCVELYGETAELHDRVVGEPGSFERLAALVRRGRNGRRGVLVRLPVTRYTFHRLPRIAATALELLERDGKAMEIPCFHPRPLEDAPARLEAHVETLRETLAGEPVELGPIDERLTELLGAMSQRAREEDEHRLLRVLGHLCDTVFTGPLRLLVDPTPLCNLDCLYCRAHSALREEINREWKRTIRGAYLDFELFKRLVDDAVELGVSSILMVGGGDPTVHPKFTEMVEYIVGKDIELNISTNGLLLNERVITAMSQLPSGSITVSISAATGPTFVKLHPRRSEADFEKLLDTLRMAARVREAAGTGRLWLKTLFVINQYNLDEIVPFVEMTRDLGFQEAWFQLVHIDPYCKFLQPTVEQKPRIERDLARAREIAEEAGIQISSYVNFQLEHLDEEGNWSRKFFEKHGCNVGWQFTYISYKGEVSFCCGMKVIDVITPERSLKEIWYSREYDRFRVAAKKIREPANAALRFRNGKPLYDPFCDCCDNHNFNEEMVRQITETGFGAYLEDLQRPVCVLPPGPAGSQAAPRRLRDRLRNALALLTGRSGA
jgi:MoaA/NifB/PqqE/SkfB family radical SAM enzyme